MIEVVAHVVLRIRHPRDARLPKDEREQLIDLKAIRIAYYVFATGALCGIPLMLHLAGAGSVAMAMAVFMAFVLSQIVKHAARIVVLPARSLKWRPRWSRTPSASCGSRTAR